MHSVSYPRLDRTAGRMIQQRIPTKILDGLKRNVSRGNSLSDELELSSVLGDTSCLLYTSDAADE